jgi:hypothetical protein
MLETGDYEHASQHITEALRLKPGDEKAMHNMQQLQQELGNTSAGKQGADDK